MSRTIRNASSSSSSSPVVKGKGRKGTKDVPTSPVVKGRKGKGDRIHATFGRILAKKGTDKDTRTEIESLLETLQEQKDAKDRDGQKGTRRKLRSLGYWGGTRTRTNWIGRVPDAKRENVVSL